MKLQKLILAVIVLIAFSMTACTNNSVAEEDNLYESTEAVDLSKGHRPGSGGN